MLGPAAVSASLAASRGAKTGKDSPGAKPRPDKGSEEKGSEEKGSEEEADDSDSSEDGDLAAAWAALAKNGTGGEQVGDSEEDGSGRVTRGRRKGDDGAPDASSARKRGLDTLQVTFTSCVAGAPFGVPLLLSPCSDLPDQLAGGFAGAGAGAEVPPRLVAWEGTRLKRLRVEADVLQLKASLRAAKDLARDGARLSEDAAAAAGRDAAVLAEVSLGACRKAAPHLLVVCGDGLVEEEEACLGAP